MREKKRGRWGGRGVMKEEKGGRMRKKKKKVRGERDQYLAKYLINVVHSFSSTLYSSKSRRW